MQLLSLYEKRLNIKKTRLQAPGFFELQIKRLNPLTFQQMLTDQKHTWQ